MEARTPSSNASQKHANARVALVLAGVAFAIFCAIILDHWPT